MKKLLINALILSFFTFWAAKSDVGFEGYPTLKRKFRNGMLLFLNKTKLYRVQGPEEQLEDKVYKSKGNYSKCLKDYNCLEELKNEHDLYFYLHMSLIKEEDGYTVNLELYSIHHMKVMDRALEMSSFSGKSLKKAIKATLNNLFKIRKSRRKGEIKEIEKAKKQKLIIKPKSGATGGIALMPGLGSTSPQSGQKNKAAEKEIIKQPETQSSLPTKAIKTRSTKGEAFYNTWWFWTGRGVLAVGGVGAFLLTGSEEDQAKGQWIVLELDLGSEDKGSSQ